MAEEEEYEEEEDEVSQKKEDENKEKNNFIPEKSVEKSEEKKETHSKKSKSKSSKNKNGKSSKNNDNAYKLQKPEHVTSTRSFLESTVTTTIQEALLELARKRDQIKDPLIFVGEYLINKAKEKNQ
jgi:hypothetical protein